MDLDSGISAELKLLADPTRACILRTIMESPTGRRSVGELATELALRQPTVSHHLKALGDEGLVIRTPDSRLAWFSMLPDQVDRVTEVLDGASTTMMADGMLERTDRPLRSVRWSLRARNRRAIRARKLRALGRLRGSQAVM